MQIEKKEWDEWKTHPVTKEVFQVLRERQDKIAHGIARGDLMESADIWMDEAIGRYREIDDLLKMDYEDLLEPKDYKVEKPENKQMY